LKETSKRLFYLSFGWLMFALGFIGAFLPVLPTTPFMILALWGFSKGSDTLHNWLYNHPKYGATLRDWDQYRIIPVKAKLASVSMMTISGTYLVFFSSAPTIGIICAIGLMTYGAIYVLTKPSRPSATVQEDVKETEEPEETSEKPPTEEPDQPPS
jgi:uncharacterized protein